MCNSTVRHTCTQVQDKKLATPQCKKLYLLNEKITDVAPFPKIY